MGSGMTHGWLMGILTATSMIRLQYSRHGDEHLIINGVDRMGGITAPGLLGV